MKLSAYLNTHYQERGGRWRRSTVNVPGSPDDRIPCQWFAFDACSVIKGDDRFACHRRKARCITCCRVTGFYTVQTACYSQQGTPLGSSRDIDTSPPAPWRSQLWTGRFGMSCTVPEKTNASPTAASRVYVKLISHDGLFSYLTG